MLPSRSVTSGMSELTAEPLDPRPLVETVIGPKRDHMVHMFRNGDVVVYPWDARRSTFGTALAGYRWFGGRLVLALGRMDPKVEAAVRELATRTYSENPPA